MQILYVCRIYAKFMQYARLMQIYMPNMQK